jgi:hypothetical protein
VPSSPNLIELCLPDMEKGSTNCSLQKIAGSSNAVDSSYKAAMHSDAPRGAHKLR